MYAVNVAHSLALWKKKKNCNEVDQMRKPRRRSPYVISSAYLISEQQWTLLGRLGLISILILTEMLSKCCPVLIIFPPRASCCLSLCPQVTRGGGAQSAECVLRRKAGLTSKVTARHRCGDYSLDPFDAGWRADVNTITPCSFPVNKLWLKLYIYSTQGSNMWISVYCSFFYIHTTILCLNC